MSFVVGDRVRFEPQNFCEGGNREGTIERPYQASRGLRWLVVWDTPQKKDEELRDRKPFSNQ